MTDGTHAVTIGEWTRALAAASLSTVGSAFPVFMLAATASLVRADIGLTEQGLGLSVSSFFAASALISTPAGALAQRIGPRRVMAVAAVLTSVAAAGVSQSMHPWQVAAAMVVAGAGNGLSAPSTNLALANVRRNGRTGIAFGVKQSALPATVIMAGFCVPLIAAPLGWRVAMVVCVLFPLLYFAIPYRDGHRPSITEVTGAPRPRLDGIFLAAVAVACASAAGTSMNAFYVENAVSGGMSVESAGLWYAVAGIVGVASRLGLGWWVDRRAHQLFKLVAALWVIGALGTLLFAGSASLLFLAAATLIGYGAGWAWNGVFHMAIVEQHPHCPAYASGVVSVGIFAGGGLGPGVTGWLFASGGIVAGWTVIAGLFAAAAITMTIRSQRLG